MGYFVPICSARNLIGLCTIPHVAYIIIIITTTTIISIMLKSILMFLTVDWVESAPGLSRTTDLYLKHLLFSFILVKEQNVALWTHNTFLVPASIILSVGWCIIYPLLLIRKSSPCCCSRFPHSISEWSFTICLIPYNRK